jgi:hypothetical protein
MPPPVNTGCHESPRDVTDEAPEGARASGARGAFQARRHAGREPGEGFPAQRRGLAVDEGRLGEGRRGELYAMVAMAMRARLVRARRRRVSGVVTGRRQLVAAPDHCAGQGAVVVTDECVEGRPAREHNQRQRPESARKSSPECADCDHLAGLYPRPVAPGMRYKIRQRCRPAMSATHPKRNPASLLFKGRRTACRERLAVQAFRVAAERIGSAPGPDYRSRPTSRSLSPQQHRLGRPRAEEAVVCDCMLDSPARRP